MAYRQPKEHEIWKKTPKLTVYNQLKDSSKVAFLFLFIFFLKKVVFILSEMRTLHCQILGHNREMVSPTLRDQQGGIEGLLP